MSTETIAEQDSLLTARQTLKMLETTQEAWPTRYIDYLVAKIDKGVNAGGSRLCALDPKGLASDADMEKKIDDAAARAHLISARAEYSRLLKTTADTDYNDLDFIMKQMNDHLHLAKASLRELDPTSRATKELYEGVLKNYKARGHIAVATEGFEAFEKTSNNYGPADVDFTANVILSALKAAGKTMCALDTKGKSTDAEMEARFEGAKKRAHIISAREKFRLLDAWSGKSKDTCEGLVVRIREHFAKAGVDASVLDPEGKKPAWLMEKKMQDCLARQPR